MLSLKKNMKKILLTAIFAFFLNSLFSQQDKGKFITYPFGFYENEIMKSITGKSPEERNVKTNRTFIMDFEGKKYPVDINKYKTVYHNNPLSQGNSGTCWAYAATSFIESEIYRKNNIKVKLSELYVVYYEYLEKAQTLHLKTVPQNEIKVICETFILILKILLCLLWFIKIL